MVGCDRRPDPPPSVSAEHPGADQRSAPGSMNRRSGLRQTQRDGTASKLQIHRCTGLHRGGGSGGHHPGCVWRVGPGHVASAPSAANPAAGPVGPLRAPGGPFLVDQTGRTVLLHGVDLVYKIPPYEVDVNGSGRNVLTPAEAQRMAQLGFTVVRLGIIWKGLEPGTDPINDPAICTPGAPRASGSGQSNCPGPRRLSVTAAGHGLAAGPVRDLLAHRHAPGRLQRGLRRRRGTELGGVHRRSHPRTATERGQLECQLHRAGRGPGLRSLLGERRGGEPPGAVRRGVDQGRRPLPRRPLGDRLRPLQRAVRRRAWTDSPTTRHSTPCWSASTPAGPTPG